MHTFNGSLQEAALNMALAVCKTGNMEEQGGGGGDLRQPGKLPLLGRGLEGGPVEVLHVRKVGCHSATLPQHGCSSLTRCMLASICTVVA